MGELTRAQLLDLNEDHRTQIRSLQGRLAEAEAAIPNAPRAVPEATALAAAIRAFDQLKDAADGRRTTWPNDLVVSSPIRRVLVALADRYGIPLIDTKFEPCQRTHLDHGTTDADVAHWLASRNGQF